MSPFEKKTNCRDVAPLLVFYVCDELSDEEREGIETHLANCQACSAQLAEEKDFHSTLTSAPPSADELEASGILLAQCRSELEEVLDDLSAPPLQEHWRPFGWLRRWMALRPAWSGALLIFLGVLVGTQIVPWMQNGSRTNGQAMDIRARQPLTPEQPSKMVIGGVSLSPSPGSESPNVKLDLSAEQPLVLQGSVEASDMRGILT